MSIKHKARRAVGTTGRLVLRLATDLKWENIWDFRPAQHKTGTLTPINISIPYQHPRTQSKSVIYTTAERIRRRGQEGKESSSNKATSSVHIFPPLPRISQPTGYDKSSRRRRRRSFRRSPYSIGDQGVLQPIQEGERSRMR